MIDGQLYKRLVEDQANVGHWLTANAVFGAIVVVGLVAMAVVGSFDSGVTQRAAATAQIAQAGGPSIGVQTRTPSRPSSHHR